MPSEIGARAVVVSGETDQLRMRLLDDAGAELTLDGGETNEIVITDHNNTTVVPATSVSVSGSLGTYSRTWDTSTFPYNPSGENYGDFAGTRRDWRRRIRTYKATWTLSTATTSYTRTQYFELVRRRFRSQLTLGDVKLLYPSIDAQITDPTLAAHLAESWDEIEQDLWARFADYPGNLFFPGAFKNCHQFRMLSRVYLENSFGSGLDEDWVKHERFAKLANDAYERAAANIAYDYDDDGILDANEGTYIATNIEVVR